MHLILTIKAELLYTEQNTIHYKRIYTSILYINKIYIVNQI